MHRYLMEMLQCPACRGRLSWTINDADGERIESAKATCAACSAAYPVREGIGLFLTAGLEREDLWEETETELTRYLREHPQVEARLMGADPDALSPADLFYRAQLLESRGEYGEAARLAERALSRCYTPGYLACHKSLMHALIERLRAAQDPIVDLASGRGGLVEAVARELPQLVVATDFSPRILRRDRRWLRHSGLYDRVSLLAFDARRTPFRDGAVHTLTTNLGLPNIRQPGELLRELRRIVAGTFLAITHFYPEEDEANGRLIREAGLASFLYRRSALEEFAAAGWQVEIASSQRATAAPTPRGEVLEGAGIDALPVAETSLEWCLLVAR
ncbi:MAG: methyltransferase domain-containing protein [Anaerolineae bacterium]|nr:methyltransferase domain-containing protein [Anaerolineae bacterium]